MGECRLLKTFKTEAGDAGDGVPLGYLYLHSRPTPKGVKTFRCRGTMVIDMCNACGKVYGIECYAPPPRADVMWLTEVIKEFPPEQRLSAFYGSQRLFTRMEALR